MVIGLIGLPGYLGNLIFKEPESFLDGCHGGFEEKLLTLLRLEGWKLLDLKDWKPV